MDIDIFQLPGILLKRFHYVLVSVVATLSLGIFYIVTLTPTYTAQTQLLLDPFGLVAEGVDVRGNSATSQQDQFNLDSQLYVMQSRVIMTAVVERMKLETDAFLMAEAAGLKIGEQNSSLAVVEALKSIVTVERAGQSLVFAISVKHPDAGKAADIANAIAAVYLQELNDSRGNAARRAQDSFQAQADELRERVFKAELAVEEFKSDNGLVSSGQNGLLIDQQIAGISEQLTAARVIEEERQTIFNEIQTMTVGSVETGTIPEALQSTAIGQLQERLSALVDRRSQLATNLGASHPQIRQVNSQIESIQQSIQSELAQIRRSMEVNYNRAVANTKALSDRLNELSKSGFDSNAASIKLRQLESEAEAVKTLYDAFLTRAEELGQQQSVNTNNSRIIAAAVPVVTSMAKLKLLVLVASALFGTALGSCLAVLREVLGRSPLTAKQLSTATGLPVLATIATTAPAPASRLVELYQKALAKVGTPAAAYDDSLKAAARRLLDEFGSDRPITVVFAATGSAEKAQAMTADLVAAFAEAGETILYAPGKLSKVTRPRARSTRGSMDTAVATEADVGNATSETLLHYERIAAAAPAIAAQAGPSLSTFVARKRKSGGELVIVNACMPPAANHISSLARTADAIIIVSDLTESSLDEFDDLFVKLADARDTVLGCVLLEKR